MWKVISRSDCARQTPELLGPGKGTKRRPNRTCASKGYLSTKPEWRRPERCMQPRAGLRRFLAEQHRVWVVCAVSRGRHSMAETLWAHASVIRLQHPSLPTAWLNKWALKKKNVSTTAPLVSGWKSDTEETSKQKKLNRGNRLGSDPTLPTPP